MMDFVCDLLAVSIAAFAIAFMVIVVPVLALWFGMVWILRAFGIV